MAPEALPKNEPKCDNWPPDSLRFRFDYEFLPSGLIPRFIVEAHPRLTNTRWRQGAALEAGGCLVLVKGDLERRRIDILVDGAKHQRRAALVLVLLVLTGVGVATIAYGDTKLQAPLPEFVYNLLGVPRP